MALGTNLPLAILGHETRQVPNGPNHSRVLKLLFGQRVDEPFQDVAGGLDATLNVRIVGPTAEPVRAETSVGVLQLERVSMVRIHVFSCSQPLPLHRLATRLTVSHGIAEAHHAVRAAAGHADDRLCEFLFDQPRNAPRFSAFARPGGIGIQVVDQTDQLEGQLRVWAACALFEFDQIGEREMLSVDTQVEVRLHLALGKHREELSFMALNSRAVRGLQSTAAHRKQPLPSARTIPA